ncbi:hypothetical protein SDC9_185489 [bioreactor metagenome]|uniref:Uncharacterized protein n=1 Tax=bioreactor metagenome TaxID=1076179 RepID=A0A645HG06_9ZZZZ
MEAKPSFKAEVPKYEINTLVAVLSLMVIIKLQSVLISTSTSPVKEFNAPQLGILSSSLIKSFEFKSTCPILANLNISIRIGSFITLAGI